MFTGIVEEKGRILSLAQAEQSWRLKVGVETVGEGVAVGDSVAVNGCCLTAVEASRSALTFDLLEETRQVTNLKDLREGSSVNLERSLRFDGRVGGHFVTGHIDGQGEVLALEPDGKDVILRLKVPQPFQKYLVYKGCIAIDGISLTVARVEDDVITLWLIPHTLAVTNLGERQAGSALNLEFDLLAKYTERLLEGKPMGSAGAVPSA